MLKASPLPSMILINVPLVEDTTGFSFSVTNTKPLRRQKMEVKEQSIKVEGLRTRRSKTTSFQAAMELKAKRAMTLVGKTVYAYIYHVY